MQMLFGCLLMSVVHCNVLKTRPFQYESSEHNMVSKDLSNRVDEEFKSYLAVSGRGTYDKEVDVYSQNHQIYLDRLHSKMLQEYNQKPKYQQTAYLLVKTMRQRDKRYISYLTLCHFKICNMGRKRTTRYFHMIRTLDGNDTP